ncbi:ATP-binding protein [Streptomyces sp. NPDC048462]|uniref:ATP-binding protein n=1 Tax=Streptomyces sp. NPDC048462 TaxID=3365555 RepID=UPI00371A61EE
MPREPRSAARARRLVRLALDVWGLDDLADDGALIVSELVSNAVQHARRQSIRVGVDRRGAARVCVGVVDFSRVPPTHRAPMGEHGRGLLLVATLAGSWGTEPLPWGKRVWAELHREGRG